MFSKSVDRHRTQKFLLERLKIWHLIVIFVMFMALFVAFVVAGFLLDPQTLITLTQQSATDRDSLAEIYSGDRPVIAEFGSFNPLNRDVGVTLTIENKKFGLSSLEHFSLLLHLTLSGLSTADSDKSETLLSIENTTKSLTCDRANHYCDSIYLFHEPVVRYSVYRISVTFANITNLFEQDQLGVVTISASLTNMIFTLYELLWRNVFLFLSLFVITVYLLLMVVFSQPGTRLPHRWATEQKWTALLLFGVILLNNPYFIFDLFTSMIIFPIMDAIFRSTFMALFMLALLVLTHCAVLPRQHKRSFFTFYIPKLCLVLVMWLIGVITFTWMRVNELQNPAYSFFEEASFMIAIQILFLVFFGGYICYLIILIGLGFYRCCCDPKVLRNHKPFVFRRFTFLWLVTFIVILISIVGVIMMFVRPGKAAEYLSFFALYNVYTYCLAVAFLPAPIFLKKAVVGEEEDLDAMPLVDLTENDQFALVDDGADNPDAENDIDDYLDDMGDSLRNRLEMMGGTGDQDEYFDKTWEEHNAPSVAATTASATATPANTTTTTTTTQSASTTQAAEAPEKPSQQLT